MLLVQQRLSKLAKAGSICGAVGPLVMLLLTESTEQVSMESFGDALLTCMGRVVDHGSYRIQGLHEAWRAWRIEDHWLLSNFWGKRIYFLGLMVT